MQTITRKGSFDAMHRVMNERVKCYNIHGHTYLYELTFEFENMEKIGYAIDFKEIKRIGGQWIDDILDHGAILNPDDSAIIETANKLNSKLFVMPLNNGSYCNPSVENIAKVVFLAMEILFKNIPGIKIHNVRIWETPNSYTDCGQTSISDTERASFVTMIGNEISSYADSKGIIDYYDSTQL